ncbi:MAG: Hint domain-containing protein [Pseudomonadota bacterium]
MPDLLNGLFFSELLVDNAGGGAVNVNGQGGANKQDEFIEIQNASGGSVNLDGYQLWSDQNGLLHTFGTGDQVANGDTATVVGTYNNPPSGFYGANGNNNSSSGNGGFLEDGEGSKFDTIYLVDPDGNYVQLSYGDPPVDPSGLPSGFPSGGSLQGDGEALNTNAPNATSITRDADGNLEEGTPTPGAPGPVCFASGTWVRTARGNITVDDLRPGMRIHTKDNGLRTLLAIRRAPIGKSALRLNPAVRPVVIPQGLIGNTATLRLSPAHRVLFAGWMPEYLFGDAEVLVSAATLVGHGGVHVDTTHRQVVYYHLLFDEHQIISANGCWSESLYLGDAADAVIRLAAGWQKTHGLELETLCHARCARRTLRRFEANVLLTSLFRETPHARTCLKVAA